MFINFNKRKYLLAQNRSAISEEKWANYLYNTYPEWWESEYKDIWFLILYIILFVLILLMQLFII